MKKNLLFSFLLFSTVVCFAADNNQSTEGKRTLPSAVGIDGSSRSSTENLIAKAMEKGSEGLSKQEKAKLDLLAALQKIQVEIQSDGTAIVNKQSCTCPACNYKRLDVQSASSNTDISGREGKRKRNLHENEGR